MNHDQDVERAVRDWLVDGPTTFSSRAFVDVLSEVHGTAQERRRGRTAWWLQFPRPVRLAFSMVVVVAVAVLGFVALRPQTQLPAVGSLPPQPAPSLVLGLLPAGTYTSLQVIPHVTMTVPTGLILRGERPDNLWLATGYAADAAEFDVIRTAETGVVDRLARDSRITASAITPLTVAGFAARSITISVPAGAYAVAGRNTFLTDAVIVAQPKDWYIYLVPGSTGRVIELTVGSSTVLLFSQAPAAEQAAFADVVDRIVASLAFPS